MQSFDEIAAENEISEREFSQMSKAAFYLFKETNKTDDLGFARNREEFISAFVGLLHKYLETLPLEEKKRRLEVINFIDKLNFQLELAELRRGKTGFAEIEAAAHSFGLKAQSSFETK